MTFLDDQDLHQDLHGEPDDELLDGRDAVVRHLYRLMAGRVAQAVDTAQERVLRACIEPGWQQGGTCGSADPDAWFPDKAGQLNPVVRAICVQCPVRRSCLATAVLFAEDGTWAGTSLFDRRPVFQALRAGADPAEVLDDVLAHQDASIERRGPSRTQRWSGKPTSIDDGKHPHSAAGSQEAQNTGQRPTGRQSRMNLGPEAA